MKAMDYVNSRYIRELAAKGVREDGRKAYDFRSIKVSSGIIKNAEGSSQVDLGLTRVMVGIKMIVDTPMEDTPDMGNLVVSAGRIDEHVVLDLNMIEDNYSDADMPTAIAHRNGDILLLQMDGGLTKEQFHTALGMIQEAGKKISAIQRQALIDVYSAPSEEVKR